MGAIWFAELGARDLFHPDEGRYAEIPREMVQSGDWITPRLDGLKYFEKPPLQYWATAAAYRLFGVSNATARLWPALLGFVGVLWIGFVGRRLFGKAAGASAALVLASSLLWVAMGHILTLDMGFSVFLALALGAFAIAQTDRDDTARCRRWMLLAWAALAAATLSKGPVAVVLAGGSLAIYRLWQRDRELLRHLSLGPGLLLFLVLAAPWFFIVAARNPGFAGFYFVHEHLARFATDVAGRVHPWWMFLPVVVIGSAPWIGSTIAVLVRPGFAWRSGAGGFDPGRFLWVWSAFTVAFFSVSHSKLIPYVLPVFPALALLVGRRLSERRRAGSGALAAASLGLLLLGLSLAPSRFASASLPLEVLLGCRLYVVVGSLLLIAAGAIGYGWRTNVPRATGVVGIASLASYLVMLSGMQAFATIESSRKLAEAILPFVREGAPVFCVNRYEQPLPFYLGRTVDLVHVRDELDFGLKEAPDREIPDLETFRAVWGELDRGVAILPPGLSRSMEESGTPMRRIYEDARRVAVARK